MLAGCRMPAPTFVLAGAGGAARTASRKGRPDVHRGIGGSRFVTGDRTENSDGTALSCNKLNRAMLHRPVPGGPARRAIGDEITGCICGCNRTAGWECRPPRPRREGSVNGYNCRALGSIVCGHAPTARQRPIGARAGGKSAARSKRRAIFPAALSAGLFFSVVMVMQEGGRSGHQLAPTNRPPSD